MNKMMSGHEFAKTLGIDANYVYNALERFPPEHTERPDLAHILHPMDEIAKSVRVYSSWKAGELKEQYKEKLAKVAKNAKKAGEVLERLKTGY